MWRSPVAFSVAYGTDIEKVKSLIRAAVLELPVVLSKLEPQIWLAEHAESKLAFLAAIWVEGLNARQPARITDIVLSTIYNSLQKHNIEIPLPQMDLRLRDPHPQSIAFSGITNTMLFKEILKN